MRMRRGICLSIRLSYRPTLWLRFWLLILGSVACAPRAPVLNALNAPNAPSAPSAPSGSREPPASALSLNAANTNSLVAGQSDQNEGSDAAVDPASHLDFLYTDIGPGPALPEQIPGPVTQLEMNIQSCALARDTAAQLREVIKRIRERYRDDAAFLAQFERAQRAWDRLAYEDLELAFPGKEEEKPVVYGSVYPMCRCNELKSLYSARATRLDQWLTQHEGDVCAGTRR